MPQAPLPPPPMPHRHGRVAFLLPGISRSLAVRRKEAVLEAGASLGRKLQVRRQVLGHRQIDAAAIVGVDPKTWMWWERDEREPYVHQYPAIIRYLSYEPWPTPSSLGELLLAERRRRGVSVATAAELIGVDEGTFGRWERGEWKPQLRSHQLVAKLLAVS